MCVHPAQALHQASFSILCRASGAWVYGRACSNCCTPHFLFMFGGYTLSESMGALACSCHPRIPFAPRAGEHTTSHSPRHQGRVGQDCGRYITCILSACDLCVIYILDEIMPLRLHLVCCPPCGLIMRFGFAQCKGAGTLRLWMLTKGVCRP